MAGSSNGTAPGTATLPPRPTAWPTDTSIPVVAPAGRRRWGMFAFAVLVIALGGLASTWLVAAARTQDSVLVLARDVPIGSELTAADLAAARVNLEPSVVSIPAADAAQVVGQVATADLSRGSLLSPTMVAPIAPPTAGTVLVGVAVPASRMPVGPLLAGDRVLIVDTPPADADPPTTPPGTVPATVVRLGPPDVNGARVLDVTVTAADGPALVARSATGRVGLLLLSREPSS